ncbi:MAG: hypothetical protein HYT72_03250 [Candidatus Aenigmarchaeota archaeon]|nr:hypothetical protein [Candidatus Aenigmarchaeota archaeon]
MDDLQGLNQRLSALENRIKTNFFEVEKRLAETEQKPGGESIGEERLQEIEDLVLLLQIESTKIKEKIGTQDVIESAPLLEQRITKIEEKLGQGVPQNLETRIAEIEKGISSLKVDLPKIEEKIASRPQGPITVTSKDADVYIERMNKTRIEIENALNRLKVLKDTVENFSTERGGVLQKIQNVEVDIERASTAFTKIKTIEEKINADIEKVEALKEGIDTKISGSSEKTESARKDVENRIFATEEKFKARMEKLDAVQQSLETKIGAMNAKAAELDVIKPQIMGLNKLVTAIEEEAVQRAALEKHVQDLAGKVTAMYNIRKTLEENYAKTVSLEKRMQDMGYSMDRWIGDVNSKLAAIDAVHSDVEDTSSQVAALERKIIETGKRMADMETYLATISEKVVGEVKTDMDKIIEEKANEFSAKIRGISGSLNIEEIRKMRDETAEQQMKLNDLEGKLELAATRFFTENLEQFAASLDRKFPDFVQKKDYARDVAEISQKLKSIESPDLSPLAERVMFLERRLTDIYNMMKSMSSRMPVVVE